MVGNDLGKAWPGVSGTSGCGEVWAQWIREKTLLPRPSLMSEKKAYTVYQIFVGRMLPFLHSSHKAALPNIDAFGKNLNFGENSARAPGKIYRPRGVHPLPPTNDFSEHAALPGGRGRPFLRGEATAGFALLLFFAAAAPGPAFSFQGCVGRRRRMRLVSTPPPLFPLVPHKKEKRKLFFFSTLKFPPLRARLHFRVTCVLGEA